MDNRHQRPREIKRAHTFQLNYVSMPCAKFLRSFRGILPSRSGMARYFIFPATYLALKLHELTGGVRFILVRPVSPEVEITVVTRTEASVNTPVALRVKPDYKKKGGGETMLVCERE